MNPDWLQLVLGPLGALVLSVSLAWGAIRELRRRHALEVEFLSEQLRERTAERDDASGRLEDEHRARLADAKATTETLLTLNDRIHQTLDRLERLTRPPR